MASITKRGASYQVQVRRKDNRNISKCFKSHSEAKAYARQIEASLDAGASSLATIRQANIPSLLDALTRYEQEIIPQKKAAAKELSFTRQWKAHKLAHKSLTKISAKDLANHRDDRLRAGKAPSSVVRELAVLSHLFTIALKEWGFEVANPVQKIRKPRVANARSNRPSACELGLILSAITNPEIRAFVSIAAQTALRRSELFALEWPQVDCVKQLVLLKDTKNGSSRTVVISSKAAAELQALRGTNQAQGRVFSIRHIDTPSKAFKRAVEAARGAYEAQCLKLKLTPLQGHLEGYRLHDMRHEATSSLFEKGLSAMEVSAITGHKTLSMLSRYTHLSNAHLIARLG